MDISVLKIDPVTRVVSFKLTYQKITGIRKLLQLVILSLLNIPGKDILDPSRGGGLPDLIGGNIDSSDFSEIVGELTRRVRKTESELLASQSGLSLIPAERLKEIRILGIAPGLSEDEVKLNLRIMNELGQTEDAVL